MRNLEPSTLIIDVVNFLEQTPAEIFYNYRIIIIVAMYLKMFFILAKL